MAGDYPSKFPKTNWVSDSATSPGYTTTKGIFSQGSDRASESDIDRLSMKLLEATTSPNVERKVLSLVARALLDHKTQRVLLTSTQVNFYQSRLETEAEPVGFRIHQTLSQAATALSLPTKATHARLGEAALFVVLHPRVQTATHTSFDASEVLSVLFERVQISDAGWTVSEPKSQVVQTCSMLRNPRGDVLWHLRAEMVRRVEALATQLALHDVDSTPPEFKRLLAVDTYSLLEAHVEPPVVETEGFEPHVSPEPLVVDESAEVEENSQTHSIEAGIVLYKSRFLWGAMTLAAGLVVAVVRNGLAGGLAMAFGVVVVLDGLGVYSRVRDGSYGESADELLEVATHWLTRSQSG
jgi:hypothetical protein